MQVGAVPLPPPGDSGRRLEERRMAKGQPSAHSRADRGVHGFHASGGAVTVCYESGFNEKPIGPGH
jgi:hypothetical protein